MKLIKLGWNSTPARLEMRGNGNQNVLDLQTEKPRLEMKSELGKLHIDQSACFSEAGRKGVTDFRQDVISYAQSVFARGVARIVDNGDQFIDIHTGVNAVAEQADYNAFGMFEQQFGYAVIPKSRPKITVDPATLNYHFTPGRVHVGMQDRKVQSTYYPGRIEYYIKPE